MASYISPFIVGRCFKSFALFFFFTFLKLPGKKMMILLTTVPPEARKVLGTEQALYKPWLSKKTNKQVYHLRTHTQRCQLWTGHINSWRATTGKDIESQCNWQVTAAASCSDSVSEKQGRLAKGTEGLSPSTRRKCPGHRAWSHPSRMGPWRGPGFHQPHPSFYSALSFCPSWETRTPSNITGLGWKETSGGTLPLGCEVKGHST